MSLSSVEVRTTKARNVTLQAQSNARFALMIAIGKLQESLGPDARATVKSSMLDTEPSTLKIDDVAHEHWLGVYPTINPEDPDLAFTDPRALRDYSLSEIEWLVSSKGDADPLSSEGDFITLGQFSEDTLTSSETLSSLAQAELLSINDNTGRFAWMVTDESMKARINTIAAKDSSDILDPLEVIIFTDKDVNYSKYQVVQSTAFENVLPGYQTNLDDLNILLTPNQLALLDDGDGEEYIETPWEEWSILNQDKFTPYSMSLPVDVANGRLKKDLTAYLKGDHTNLDGVTMIDSRFDITEDRATTFDLLKQWSNYVDDITVPQEVVAPRFSGDENGEPIAPEHGLHPLITQGSVIIQPSFKILDPEPGDAANLTRLTPIYIFQPQFQISNPHNVDLAAQDYIIQLGYTFSLGMRANGGRGTDDLDFKLSEVALSNISDADKAFINSFQWDSWAENSHGFIPPLPEHVPAHNETIDYQGANSTTATNPLRFFTFVIKDQAIKAGESLMFYAKPPSSGENHGVEYNMNSDADTSILSTYTSDEDLNLLINEGNLDEFFYFTLNEDIEGQTTALASRDYLKFGSNMTTKTGAIPDRNNFNDVDMHLNLYSHDGTEPSLLHSIKKGQANFRNNISHVKTYPLSEYQEGIIRTVTDTLVHENAVINFGSSMGPSNFDIFEGDTNANTPPKAGQPHAVLGYWNIRNQESYSEDADWDNSGVIGSDWLNSFSFRDVPTFQLTWEAVINQYGNLSSDRLGGLHLSGVDEMVFPFFDYPAGDIGPLSIGQFQHANLSAYGWQPTYAFANAQAEPRLEDRSTFKSSSQPKIYDNSYVLNTSIWDSYYLSTIPQDGSTTFEDQMRLPNSRQIITNDIPFENDDLLDTNGFNRSAANVMIHGGFNVNSTSPTAWKAFLTGLLGQTIETRLETNTNSHSDEDSVIALGRFMSPLLAEPNTVTSDRTTLTFDEPSTWSASRTLNASEIDILTTRIITEVKNRGPFLSLADFVNRRLDPSEDEANTNDEQVYQQVLGTLQAAINKATIEDQVINYHLYEEDEQNINSTEFRTVKKDIDWSNLNFTTTTESSEESMFGLPKSKIDAVGGLLHSYSPMFLSQADILSKIGPSITVRGDTFTIRAYGDTLDTEGNVVARAWCEAIVQRTAEPVDWDGLESTLIQPDLPTTTDSVFGRKLKIINFRWLHEEDLTPDT